MKQVIDGKMYNTETAELVAADDNGLGAGDFHSCYEVLYITRKGAYFLYGEGGAMTRWSQPVGNNGRTGGSGIVPLTEGEALDWCEQHDVDADEIAKRFNVEEA